MQEENNTNNNLQKATFGAGCFWCTEAIFSRIDGVLDVTPGFSGGDTKNPTYKEVLSGNTGHAEVAMINFDPEKVSYAKLLEVFFQMHNPTTINRQGADVGTQYRSVVFYHNNEQKQLCEQLIKSLNDASIWDDPIVTETVAFKEFYEAEDYHNDYFENNPANPFCQIVITPKLKKFEKVFSDILKK